MAAASAPALIQNVTHLLRARRFLPLFATQFLGAFNDSLFKQAVVLFVTYQLYSDPAKEFQFSAIAQGLFILPFFLFSALSGQLADDHDKARLIRIIKLAEIGIMIVGGAGHHARQHPADARRGVRDGRPFDLLRADQICDPAAASAQGRGARRNRPGRSRHLYRDPRRDDPRRSAGDRAVGRGGGDHRRRRARLPRRPAGPAGAARRPSGSRSTGTSSTPRSSWSARRCTSAGCSSRSCRSASSGPSARC